MHTPMNTDDPSDTTSTTSEPSEKPSNNTDVHVEICMKSHSALGDDEIEHLFNEYSQRFNRFYSGTIKQLPHNMAKHIEYIRICMKLSSVSIHNAHCHIYIFRNNEEGLIEEIDDETTDPVHVANTYTLPNCEFDGLFESLIFESNIKNRLLNYMKTVSLFGGAVIDKNLITWNGVILLHGPPGTGKTSLSKALAHKLSIRLINNFSHSSLIEINAHSLFSKWFSESGKLVQKLFKHIMELVECQDSLVFVLMDEVESLAAARKAALNGNEPSDSIRAVNALLTGIDHLRSYSNVLVLATSNISESIDLAFVDRADLKQFIGNPMEKGRYIILQSCVGELVEKKLICVEENESPYLLDYDQLKSKVLGKENRKIELNYREKCSQKFLQIVCSLKGFSGRSLRKLPFMTFVDYIETPTISLMDFLDCLHLTAINEKHERLNLKN